MPKPRFPHVHREKSRHEGSPPRWYFRRGRGPRIRLPAEYGSPEFIAAYTAALAGSAVEGAKKTVKTGSLTWLVDRYRESSAWAGLSVATRRQRENIFKGALAKSGDTAYADIDRKAISDGRERRAKTPAQARNFLDAMRGLFRWALEVEHVKIDPTASVKNPKRKKGDGFPVWTEADVDAYEERWPEGTKERVWLHVLLYTGLRRGDAVRLGPGNVSDGIATIKTEKSQFTVEVSIPLLPPLQHTLRIGPTGKQTFICGDRGNALTKETFGNDFRDACRDAGVQKSAHGVRKIGATRAANNGATIHQLEAIFGWTGGAMASLYTRAADRRRLAKEAITKMDKTPKEEPPSAKNPEPSPAPSGKVRVQDEKSQSDQEFTK